MTNNTIIRTATGVDKLKPSLEAYLEWKQDGQTLKCWLPRTIQPEPFIIGSLPKSNIPIRSKYVSRVHASIYVVNPHICNVKRTGLCHILFDGHAIGSDSTNGLFLVNRSSGREDLIRIKAHYLENNNEFKVNETNFIYHKQSNW